MKKILRAATVLVLSLSLMTGCGGIKKISSEGSGQLESMTIKLSHNQPTNSPEHIGAEAFKEKVEKLSGGNIKVDIYPSLQLGSMREQAEAVQMGSHEITLQPISVLTPFVEELQIVDFPFLWPSKEALYSILDGEAGDRLLSKAEPKGFKGLGFWAAGFKHFTTKGREIHKPSDFQGVKMRVMPSPLLLAQYEAWGAKPTPVEYAELYNALQQNIVEGQENPIQSIAMNKFYEVQDNMILSSHGYLAYVFIANKGWFDGLPKEYQDIILQAEREARNEERKASEDMESAFLEEIKGSGIKVYSLTDEEKGAFKEASKPVYGEFAKTEEMKEILDMINSKAEEFEK